MSFGHWKTSSQQINLKPGRKQDPFARAEQVKRALSKAWVKRKKDGKDKQLSRRSRAQMRSAAEKARAMLSSRDRRAERSQYYNGLRKAFKGCMRLCLTFDSSRGGSRQRSTYACMDLDYGMCAWAPPQAISETKTGLIQRNLTPSISPTLWNSISILQ